MYCVIVLNLVLFGKLVLLDYGTGVQQVDGIHAHFQNVPCTFNTCNALILHHCAHATVGQKKKM